MRVPVRQSIGTTIVLALLSALLVASNAASASADTADAFWRCHHRDAASVQVRLYGCIGVTPGYLSGGGAFAVLPGAPAATTATLRYELCRIPTSPTAKIRCVKRSARHSVDVTQAYNQGFTDNAEMWWDYKFRTTPQRVGTRYAVRAQLSVQRGGVWVRSKWQWSRIVKISSAVINA